MIFFFDTVENIVKKGENAGYQHLLLFPQFRNASFSESLKVGDCVVESYMVSFVPDAIGPSPIAQLVKYRI